MARTRQVQTKFWDDEYIETLTPLQRYFYLYLLTNPHTTMCGAYEITLKKMDYHTSLTVEQISEILEKFQRDGKICYQDGWILIKNFARHQAANPRVKRGMISTLESAPAWVMGEFLERAPDWAVQELAKKQSEPARGVNNKTKMNTRKFAKSSP